jgi:hypothetical protein
MATPGLELQQMFKLVAREVEAKTNHEQRPEISYSFSDDYYFVKGDAAPVVSVIAPVSIPVGPSPDQIAWKLIQDTKSVDILLRFIEQFPSSAHRVDAEQRIRQMASLPANHNDTRPAEPAVARPPATPPHAQTPAKPKPKPAREAHTHPHPTASRSAQPSRSCFAFNGQRVCD